MTRGTWLVSAASLLLISTLAVRAHEANSRRGDEPGGRHFSAAEQAPSNSEYLGSGACARCHDVEHTQWKNSLHIKMTKPVAEATIVGDFREGTKFADHDRSYTFGMKDGKPDRKSTRLNSSHGYISYAVFCLKKK